MEGRNAKLLQKSSKSTVCSMIHSTEIAIENIQNPGKDISKRCTVPDLFLCFTLIYASTSEVDMEEKSKIWLNCKIANLGIFQRSKNPNFSRIIFNLRNIPHI